MTKSEHLKDNKKTRVALPIVGLGIDAIIS
jgi:hypothetical protein